MRKVNIFCKINSKFLNNNPEAKSCPTILTSNLSMIIISSTSCKTLARTILCGLPELLQVTRFSNLIREKIGVKVVFFLHFSSTLTSINFLIISLNPVIYKNSSRPHKIVQVNTLHD